jgi:hypothetical protein
MNSKLIIYIIGCAILFLMIIKWGNYIIQHKTCIEGLTEFEEYSRQIIPYPDNATINYNDLNSPLYSHTVNLPINDPVSCKNFCGPKAQCAITRDQCSADIDCPGCNPGPTTLTQCETKDVAPYDNGGKLGQNLGLQYSPLTTGFDNHNIDFAEVYPGSKEAQIIQPYQGVDRWTKSFNQGLEFYNKKRASDAKYSEGISQDIIDLPDQNLDAYQPKYKTTISATGQFYETTPTASNAYLS